ncbi:MAG TPA: RNA polymerase sigma factor [Solirubrobacteraceae bacterium]|jgi:RNA polymerase sigma-70 factor (ECF subfamily)|nr:RNA polymerase sigma factor [Solirubrobacteraceae bacterium]
MSLAAHVLGRVVPAAVKALAALAILPARAGDADADLIDALREGDEEAFLALVTRHQGMLLRVARSFVSSRAVAEEVVQDTWVGVLRGIEGFAGRATVRTWMLAILVNRARSTGALEQRSFAVGDAGPVVDAARFDASGAWSSPPLHWREDVEDRVFAESLSERIEEVLAELPPRQREVLVLRDVEGLSGHEVCDLLGITDGNQRVLLHRGRGRMRAALEPELGAA